MKVPVCTPCKWSLGVYSGRSSSELWLAACLPTVTVASLCKQVETGESERRSSKSRLTSLQHPRRHRAGRERLRVFLGKQHPSRRSHGQHRGPADQAGVQRSSQKWRGVVTSLLLSPPPYSNPKCVLVVCYSRCQISTDSMLEPPQKITSANVRARSRRVVVGQALNRLTTLALAWYQCWVEPLLAVPGGRVQETPGT